MTKHDTCPYKERENVQIWLAARNDMRRLNGAVPLQGDQIHGHVEHDILWREWKLRHSSM